MNAVMTVFKNPYKDHHTILKVQGSRKHFDNSKSISKQKSFRNFEKEETIISNKRDKEKITIESPEKKYEAIIVDHLNDKNVDDNKPRRQQRLPTLTNKITDILSKTKRHEISKLSEIKNKKFARRNSQILRKMVKHSSLISHESDEIEFTHDLQLLDQQNDSIPKFVCVGNKRSSFLSRQTNVLNRAEIIKKANDESKNKKLMNKFKLGLSSNLKKSIESVNEETNETLAVKKVDSKPRVNILQSPSLAANLIGEKRENMINSKNIVGINYLKKETSTEDKNLNENISNLLKSPKLENLNKLKSLTNLSNLSQTNIKQNNKKNESIKNSPNINIISKFNVSSLISSDKSNNQQNDKQGLNGKFNVTLKNLNSANLTNLSNLANITNSNVKGAENNNLPPILNINTNPIAQNLTENHSPIKSFEKNIYTVYTYKQIKVISSGESFGELALESSKGTRAITFIAQTDVNTAYLNRHHYNLCIYESNKKANKLTLDFIIRTPIFKYIPVITLEKKLLQNLHFQLVHYQRLILGEEDSRVCKTGYVVMLKKGEFEVRIKRSIAELIEIIKYYGLSADFLNTFEAEEKLIKQQFNGYLMFKTQRTSFRLGYVKDFDVLGLSDTVNLLKDDVFYEYVCKENNCEIFSIKFEDLMEIVETEDAIMRNFKNYLAEKKANRVKKLEKLVLTQLAHFRNTLEGLTGETQVNKNKIKSSLVRLNNIEIESLKYKNELPGEFSFVNECIVERQYADDGSLVREGNRWIGCEEEDCDKSVNYDIIRGNQIGSNTERLGGIGTVGFGRTLGFNKDPMPSKNLKFEDEATQLNAGADNLKNSPLKSNTNKQSNKKSNLKQNTKQRKLEEKNAKRNKSLLNLQLLREEYDTLNQKPKYTKRKTLSSKKDRSFNEYSQNFNQQEDKTKRPKRNKKKHTTLTLTSKLTRTKVKKGTLSIKSLLSKQPRLKRIESACPKARSDVNYISRNNSSTSILRQKSEVELSSFNDFGKKLKQNNFNGLRSVLSDNDTDKSLSYVEIVRKVRKNRSVGNLITKINKLKRLNKVIRRKKFKKLYPNNCTKINKIMKLPEDALDQNNNYELLLKKTIKRPVLKNKISDTLTFVNNVYDEVINDKLNSVLSNLEMKNQNKSKYVSSEIFSNDKIDQIDNGSQTKHYKKFKNSKQVKTQFYNSKEFENNIYGEKIIKALTLFDSNKRHVKRSIYKLSLWKNLSKIRKDYLLNVKSKKNHSLHIIDRNGFLNDRKSSNIKVSKDKNIPQNNVNNDKKVNIIEKTEKREIAIKQKSQIANSKINMNTNKSQKKIPIENNIASVQSDNLAKNKIEVSKIIHESKNKILASNDSVEYFNIEEKQKHVNYIDNVLINTVDSKNENDEENAILNNKKELDTKNINLNKIKIKTKIHKNKSFNVKQRNLNISAESIYFINKNEFQSDKNLDKYQISKLDNMNILEINKEVSKEFNQTLGTIEASDYNNFNNTKLVNQLIYGQVASISELNDLNVSNKKSLNQSSDLRINQPKHLKIDEKIIKNLSNANTLYSNKIGGNLKNKRNKSNTNATKVNKSRDKIKQEIIQKKILEDDFLIYRETSKHLLAKSPCPKHSSLKNRGFAILEDTSNQFDMINNKIIISSLQQVKKLDYIILDKISNLRLNKNSLEEDTKKSYLEFHERLALKSKVDLIKAKSRKLKYIRDYYLGSLDNFNGFWNKENKLEGNNPSSNALKAYNKLRLDEQRKAEMIESKEEMLRKNALRNYFRFRNPKLNQSNLLENNLKINNSNNIILKKTDNSNQNNCKLFKDNILAKGNNEERKKNKVDRKKVKIDYSFCAVSNPHFNNTENKIVLNNTLNHKISFQEENSNIHLINDKILNSNQRLSQAIINGSIKSLESIKYPEIKKININELIKEKKIDKLNNYFFNPNESNIEGGLNHRIIENNN